MTPIDQNFSAPPDSPEETKPIAVFIVIGALALFFILECVLSLMPLKGLLEPDNVTLVAMGALDKYYLPQGQYYRLFTAALLHADLMHLGLNCLALAFSGMLLESLVGRSRFLVTWFLGALGGSALSVAWHKENFVGVGASGAGMAVLAAVLLAAMRLPQGEERTQVQINMLRFLVPSLLPIATSRGGGSVDVAAHVGGALVGLLFGAVFWLEPSSLRRPLTALTGLLAAVLLLACLGSVALAARDFTGIAISNVQKGEADGFAAALEPSCELGSATACEVLGAKLVGGHDPQQMARVVSLLEKPCAQKSYNSCFNLGLAYFEEGPARDVKKAATAWTVSCDGAKDPEACFNAALALRNDAPKENAAEIKRLELLACDGNVFRGCFNAATTADDETAIKLYKKACDGNDGLACTNLGNRFAAGDKGVPEDDAEAARLYQKACELKDGLGCFLSGIVLWEGTGVKQDDVAAVQQFKTACDLHEFAACAEWGWAQLHGRGMKQDVKAALQRLYELCRGDQADSCAYLGEFYATGSAAEGIAPDPKLAAEYTQAACDNGREASCPSE